MKNVISRMGKVYISGGGGAMGVNWLGLCANRMTSPNFGDYVDILSSSTSGPESEPAAQETPGTIADENVLLDLYTPLGLNALLSDLIQNYTPRHTKQSLVDWLETRKGSLDPKSLAFLEANSKAIARFRTKRQLVGFLRGCLNPSASKSGGFSAKAASQPTMGLLFAFVWFALGVLSTFLIGGVLSQLCMRHILLLVEWRIIDRKYIGYLKSLSSIWVALLAEHGN